MSNPYNSLESKLDESDGLGSLVHFVRKNFAAFSTTAGYGLRHLLCILHCPM